jgi:hypothetical protein
MIKNIPVRFFIFDFCEDSQEHYIFEVDEPEFLEFVGEISYSRETVF